MLKESKSEDAFPAEGETFAERYEIGPLLGVGGFANVYRATQVDIGRDVAIKILAPERVGRTEGLNTAERRFYREARLLSRLQGPNTIRLYDYGRTADGLLFTVFEYIDGTELDVLLAREGPFDQDRAVHLLEQILRSLHEAHSYDILHRDVKPSNVLVYNRLGEPDQVKLLDFGIAKMVAAEARGDEPLTRTGLVVGTPKYMSPEQAVDRTLGPPSDLFSAGLIFYEMLVGSSPYDDSSLSSIRDRIMSAPIRIPRGVDIDEDLREIGNQLLERNVEDRYQEASQVLTALGVELTDSKDSSSRRVEQSNQISFPISLDTSGIAPVDDLTDASKRAGPDQSSSDSPDTGEIAAQNDSPNKSAQYDPGETIVDPNAGPPPIVSPDDADELARHEMETAVLKTPGDSLLEPEADDNSSGTDEAESDGSYVAAPRATPAKRSDSIFADRSHLLGAASGAALAVAILGVWAYSSGDDESRAESVHSAAEKTERGDESPDRAAVGSANSETRQTDQERTAANPDVEAAKEPSMRRERERTREHRRALREAHEDIVSAIGAGVMSSQQHVEDEGGAREDSASETGESGASSKPEVAAETKEPSRTEQEPEPAPESAAAARSKPSGSSTSSRKSAPSEPKADDRTKDPSPSSDSSDDEGSTESNEIKPIDEYLQE